MVGLSGCTCSLETPLAALPFAFSVAVPTVIAIFVFKAISLGQLGNVRLQAVRTRCCSILWILAQIFLCAAQGGRNRISAMSHPRRALAGDRRLTTLHHWFHDRWLMRTIVALIALR